MYLKTAFNEGVQHLGEPFTANPYLQTSACFEAFAVGALHAQRIPNCGGATFKAGRGSRSTVTGPDGASWRYRVDYVGPKSEPRPRVMWGG